MTSIWRLLPTLAALCLASCTGDTETATSEKQPDWKVQCSPQNNYFSFDASWSDRRWLSGEAYTARLMLAIYTDASLTFYSSPVKFGNDISAIDEIIFRKNYIEIRFDPDVSNRTLFFYDVEPFCSRAFFAFIAGDGDFRETSIRVNDKLISEFKARHKDED